MKRHKVSATIVDAGRCRYFRTGRSFVLDGFTPQGICDSAYAVLSRDAQTLAYGGRLPWQKEGRVRTRCPDPDGALWELRIDDRAEIEPAGGSNRRTRDEAASCKCPRAQIVRALVEYFGPDDRRIEHALRVLHHAEQIMKQEPACDPEVVIAAALLHDIGIKVSEKELGYNNGRTQEKYGPPVAERLLASIGFPSHKIKKIKDIIGNHHSPSKYDYPELKVLKQADRIVNRDEKV